MQIILLRTKTVAYISEIKVNLSQEVDFKTVFRKDQLFVIVS